MHAATWFFGGRPIRTSLTNAATGTTRTYGRFAAVTKDTMDARIYLGLHFRTADVQAAWIGMKVAKWVDRHEFAPID